MFRIWTFCEEIVAGHPQFLALIKKNKFRSIRIVGNGQP
jgi:hypothetical protein